ncbi:DUF58 domain-containing protein [Propionivibrio sp.]|uniref:DUF58 domain-containing protein n=1 Tax=Propionivibrio sp. TaxID=2212460 RepID=UPI0025DADDD4|nr:DUF58 domain-containing protein [Propionivibrio sp.]MBK7356593.1 DUF58 domain-containing protein [Propionivibrio sp.]MBK8401005.1 DUF58 domain-containing protein [Propionivibrio sp.]MBK8744177.1 DUF58 domain-containing protein [Propionivibrio sp.]MBK8894291.1 DUF58 domain-containing protein [Propionivibrio sp.]MBL0207585.1 DUF58 domain-containing protein [Propionivibrio sp.]
MAVIQRFKQWLFRLGYDEQLPIVLTQRRIFILPTRSGLLFSVVLCVMLIGAINYNLSLGHALVFLLAGLGLVAMVHTFRNLVALRLAPGRVEPVFAGEVAHFNVILENEHRQARRALELAFSDHDGVTLDIPPSTQATAAIPCPAPVRGYLDPGRITLSTRYPLGLFNAWSYPHPRLSGLVYPRPVETPLPPFSAASYLGQRHGDSGQEDFTGLRIRQLNDSPRHIAWKAVARDIENRPLLIKQFAGGAAEELWLDMALTPTEGGLETQLSVLAGWVIAAEQLHARYGLRLPGLELAPGQGDAHRTTCLEALALYG